MRGRGVGILTLVYVIIGAFVAGTHSYFDHLGGLKPIIAALLGIFLWPLVLFGVNLHLK